MLRLRSSVGEGDETLQQQQQHEQPREQSIKEVADLEKGNSSVNGIATSGKEEKIANIRYRPIHEQDRIKIQELHEEWFPVRYQTEFYDELVKHRLASSGDPLHTCLAVIDNNKGREQEQQHHQKQQQQQEKEGQKQQQQQQQQKQSKEKQANIQNSNHHHHHPVGDDTTITTTIGSNNSNNGNNNSSNDDEIIGCVVGTFLSVTRLSLETKELLIPNPERHSKLFYIMTLGTIERYRHYGIATSLVQKCIDLVENDPNCGTLYLHVLPLNNAAIRFYEKLGFYRVKEIEDYYTIENKRYSCYLYARYFHGNRGHLSLFMVLSSAIQILWNRIKVPFSLLVSNTVQRTTGRMNDQQRLTM